jgi:hypothetical protein
MLFPVPFVRALVKPIAIQTRAVKSGIRRKVKAVMDDVLRAESERTMGLLVSSAAWEREDVQASHRSP